MGKISDIALSLSDKLSISRRSFIKGAVAMGALTTAYGCSKDDSGSEIIYTGGGEALTHQKI